MMRLNKDFWIFSVLAASLLFELSTAFRRFFSFLLQLNLYRCKTFFNSISINIPLFHTQTIVITVISLFTIWVNTRLFLVLFQIKKLKKQLISEMPITEELQKILQKNQLDKKTVLVQNKKIFAFCFGIYNPKIYLSSALIGLISNKEIEAVILHEKYHLENKDTLIMFIAFVSNILFPFVPIISDLLQQYRLTREINADRSAINILQDDRPLISVLKKMLNIPINNFSATASIVDDTLESRIKILANKDPKVKYFSLAHLCISTLSVLALLLIIVTPVHAVTSPIHKQSIIFCINRSSCRMVCSVAAQPNASLPFSSTQNNKNY